ncbi:MAG: response regulator [Chloroflexi bacterium]|nr:response regulator [Chloroflexota bacterium]
MTSLSNDHSILIDIQKSTFNRILAVIYLVIWIATILANPLTGGNSKQFMLLGAVVIVICGVTFGLSHRHFRLAVYILIWGLWGCVAAATQNLSQPVVYYFFATVVLFATSLMRLWSQVVLALASTAFILLFAPSEITFGAALFLWISLITSYVVSHGLLQTLDITHHYQSYAVEQMKKARDQRGEIARMAAALKLSQENQHRLNIQLRYALNSAEEARRLKAQFAANVSHELRTPINLIVGFSEVMATAPEAYGGPPPPAYRPDIQAIYRNATHLQSLISDILDISQIEAAQLAIVKEETDPHQVIDEAIRIAQGLIQGKKLELRLDVPSQLPAVCLDRTRVRQVMLTLLTNAVRFSDKGRITLRARVDEREITVSIQDTGMGIPKEQLDRVFEEFYQVESNLSRKRGGTGLGLALSRQFITQHGGRMWAESEGIPGKGSTFYFTLPLTESTLFTAHPSPYQPVDENQARQVIIWENDPAIVQMFRGYITQHTVHAAQSLRDVHTLLKSTHPLAVICDTYADVTALQQQVASVSPEITLITCPMPSGRQAARMMGLVDCLVKPVTRQQIFAALQGIEQPIQRVMIAAGERDMLRMYSRFFQTAPENYTVGTALTGMDALAMMRTDPPDVILLDFSLPDMDGFTMLEYLKSTPVLDKIPVIVVSDGSTTNTILPLVKGEIVLRKAGGFQPMELVRCIEAISGQLIPPSVLKS